MEETAARLNAMIFDTTSNNNDHNSSYHDASSHHSASHNASSSQPTRVVTSASASLASGTQSGDNDSEGSQDSYDEDDPILSLLHKPRGGNEAESNSTGSPQKSSSRFMNELDQRLAQPAADTSNTNPLQIETGGGDDQDTPAPRRLWPWPQTRQSKPTKTNNDDNNNDPNDNNNKPRPLWARPKKKKRPPAADESSFVMVSSGNLGFSDEERQALANLQQQQGVDSGNLCADHPRESFVAVTLVVAVAVYFFSRMSAADDLAL